MWLALDGEGSLYQQVYRRAARGDPRRRAAARRAAAGHARARARARRRAQHGARRLRAALRRGLRRRAHRLGHARRRRPCPRSAPRCRGAAGRAGPARARRARAARPRRRAPHPGAGAAPGVSLGRCRARACPTTSATASPPWRTCRSRPGAGCSDAARAAASAAQLAYGEPGGSPELRRALADYLRRARGVRLRAGADPVTHGTQQAIDLCRALLVDPGERRRARGAALHRLLAAPSARYGAELVPVGVDEQGLASRSCPRTRRCAASASRRRTSSRPAAILPLERRLALLAFAARDGAFVRRGRLRRRVPLRGPSDPERSRASTAAAACSTSGRASKLLFPALRIGWLVVPEPLLRVFQLAKALRRHRQRDARAARARRLHRGRPPRAARAARRACATPRGARRCTGGARRHLGDAAVLEGTPAGLHGLLWMPEPPGLARGGAAAPLRGARRRHLPDRALLHATAAPRAAYVLGYASL